MQIKFTKSIQLCISYGSCLSLHERFSMAPNGSNGGKFFWHFKRVFCLCLQHRKYLFMCIGLCVNTFVNTQLNQSMLPSTKVVNDHLNGNLLSIVKTFSLDPFQMYCCQSKTAVLMVEMHRPHMDNGIDFCLQNRNSQQ